MKQITHIIILMLFALNLSAEDEEFKPKVIPPSPTVASINKFIEVPVGHYTGLPNISIPFWEVTGNKLSMPISVSYHASGIKVEDIPGWVGQNWSLNAGGTISRTMIGKADEKAEGYFQNGDDIPDPTGNPDLLYSWQPSDTWLRDVADGTKDAEPDVFYYSFNGQSGKFVFSVDSNGDRHIHTIPHTNLDITEITVGNDIVQWIVKDQSGTKYIFGESEDSLRNAVELTFLEESNYSSSWHLMDIISANGDDHIKFYYQQYEESYDFRISETELTFERYNGLGGVDCEPGKTIQNESQISVTTFKLDKIETSKQTVLFYSTSDRLDFDGTKLNSIEIKDHGDTLRHSFSFSYGYYSAGSRTVDKRLRLEQITEKSANGTGIPPYIFTYNSTTPPARDSYAQDWWGFYNGETSNGTLVPEVFGSNPLTGANREPDESVNGTYLKAGILEQITYPTKGTTTFEYEPHDYGFIKNGTVSSDATVPLYKNVLADNISTPNYIYDTETFDIDEPQYVEVTYTLQDNTAEQEGLDASIEVQDPGGASKILLESAGTDSKIYWLSEPGTYSLIAKAFRGQYATARIDYTNIDTNQGPVKITRAGGLRVKKITETTDGKSKVKEYGYRLRSDINHSSGSLVSNIPSFHYDHYIPQFDPAEITLFLGYCEYFARTSSPRSVSGTTSGSHIGYSAVTEKIGINGSNGEIHYVFVSPKEYPDFETLSFPFPPVISKDWQRGMLKEKTIYDSVGDTVQRLENFYTIYNSTGDINRKSIPGIKVAYLKKSNISPTYDEIRFEPYEVVSGWFNLNKTIETQYFTEGDIVQETYFYYDNVHLQKKREISNNSFGSFDQIDYYYSPDYPSGTSTLTSTINTMLSKNMINSVLKKETFRNGIKSGDEVTNSAFAEGVITNFRDGSQGIVPSSVALANTDQSYDSIIYYDSYTDKGQIGEYRTSDDISTVILWDSNGNYPRAEVVGATYSEIMSVNVDLYSSSDSLYAEIKNKAPDALITTYSYKHLIGIVSKTDPNGMTTTYKYDDFGRLEMVKDHESKILNAYKYNYKIQN